MEEAAVIIIGCTPPDDPRDADNETRAKLLAESRLLAQNTGAVVDVQAFVDLASLVSANPRPWSVINHCIGVVNPARPYAQQ